MTLLRHESPTNPHLDYDVETLTVGPQPIVSLRERRPVAQLPTFIPRAYGELFGRLRVVGVPPAGHPFIIYHAIDDAVVDAEVCVPIARPVVATGRIRSSELPAATVARTLHVGPYDRLHEAYAALRAWIAWRGLEPAGPMIERYLNGPGDVASPDEYRTQIEQPVTTPASRQT